MLKFCTDPFSLVCLQSVSQDAENLKQILAQVRAPPPGPGAGPGAGPGQPTPLRALTEQLKRGRPSRTAGPLSPELAARADAVLTQLQSLNRRMESDLQLLQTYVRFLGAAQQVLSFKALLGGGGGGDLWTRGSVVTLCCFPGGGGDRRSEGGLQEERRGGGGEGGCRQVNTTEEEGRLSLGGNAAEAPRCSGSGKQLRPDCHHGNLAVRVRLIGL